MAVSVALLVALIVESDIGRNKRESDKGIAKEMVKRMVRGNDKGDQELEIRDLRNNGGRRPA
jgi:hypothetical protein